MKTAVRPVSPRFAHRGVRACGAFFPAQVHLGLVAATLLLGAPAAFAQRGGGGGNNNNNNNPGAPRNGAQNPPPPAPAPAPAPQPPPAPPRTPAAPSAGTVGGPLAGLNDAQFAAFLDGRESFRERETAASGLGPIFNDVSCVACHDAGATGGASRRTVTRFGRTSDGVFDPLEALGGSLLQNRATNPAAREIVPAAANTVARRVTTPLFGAGLIEAIADETIVAGALAPKPRGIAGKAALVRDIVSGEERIGRFGWKAQQATLLAFSGDAYLNEMGITNRFFPEENAPNGNQDLLARFDPIAGLEDRVDPADGKADVDRLADFMRLLAPPPRAAATEASRAGEAVFVNAQCAACHTPTMKTARHDIPALSEQTVALYSDLLLHDVGALGDGIAQGPAGPREMRTAPLWGVRLRPSLLHDGRANSLDAAIRAHAGEAQNSRDAYTSLGAEERQQLIAFLNTL